MSTSEIQWKWWDRLGLLARASGVVLLTGYTDDLVIDEGRESSVPEKLISQLQSSGVAEIMEFHSSLGAITLPLRQHRVSGGPEPGGSEQSREDKEFFKQILGCSTKPPLTFKQSGRVFYDLSSTGMGSGPTVSIREFFKTPFCGRKRAVIIHDADLWFQVQQRDSRFANHGLEFRRIVREVARPNENGTNLLVLVGVKSPMGIEEIVPPSIPCQEVRVEVPSASERLIALDKFVSAQGSSLTNVLRDRVISESEGMSILELKSHLALVSGDADGSLKSQSTHRSYWSHLDGHRLEAMRPAFQGRVKGQGEAITTVLRGLKLASSSIDVRNREGKGGRPRAFYLFQGPTGVGKTELARTLAEELFGSARAFKRFDMSEFSQAHADQRLVGAPPGYVGHEAGGELTEALRKQPFMVLLFDEIEKAAPRVLDLFLQILDDGRLTDGMGRTVAFGEAVIIFTTNVGASSVDPKMSRKEVAECLSTKIRQTFVSDMQRPELYNRVNTRIVPFGFLDEDAQREIVGLAVDNLTHQVRAHFRIDLELQAGVRSQLDQLAVDGRSLGGRAAMNIVEKHLAEPVVECCSEKGGVPGTLCVDSLDSSETWLWQP